MKLNSRKNNNYSKINPSEGKWKKLNEINKEEKVKII